jgi:hypothetical protein
MTDDLVAFIAARLDEDEAVTNAGARRVGMPWHAEAQPGTPGGLVTDELGLVGSTGGRYAADHIARYDPARVLREVAAKRRVLERHRPVGGTASWRAQACAGCGTEGYCDDPVTEKMSDCPELRDMAAIWDGHPDYRQEWKP